MGAEQKDSLLLAPNRRILYCWRRTEGFFTIGAEQKDRREVAICIGISSRVYRKEGSGHMYRYI